jgi:hypothetical protein
LLLLDFKIGTSGVPISPIRWRAADPTQETQTILPQTQLLLNSGRLSNALIFMFPELIGNNDNVVKAETPVGCCAEHKGRIASWESARLRSRNDGYNEQATTHIEKSAPAHEICGDITENVGLKCDPRPL